MITRPAAFRVYGEPAPKGSMIPRKLKGGRVVVVEDNKRTKPWRRAIEKAAPVHITERADKWQPVALHLVFAVTRLPAQHDVTRPVKRATGGVGGDLDKMVRLVLDALESCRVLTDDAQVTEIHAQKMFAESPDWSGRPGVPGVYCRIEPVGWVPDELPYEDTLDDTERH